MTLDEKIQQYAQKLPHSFQEEFTGSFCMKKAGRVVGQVESHKPINSCVKR
jgi:hypothetical protein